MSLVAAYCAFFSDSYSNKCSMLLVVACCTAFLDGKEAKHKGLLVAAYYALFSDSHSNICSVQLSYTEYSVLLVAAFCSLFSVSHSNRCSMLLVAALF